MPRSQITALVPLLAAIAAAFSPIGCGGDAQEEALFADTAGTGPDTGGADTLQNGGRGEDEGGSAGAGQSSHGGSGGRATSGGVGAGGADRGGSAGSTSGGKASGGTASGGGSAGATMGGLGSGGVMAVGGSQSVGGNLGSGGGPIERLVPFQVWQGPGATVTGILFASSSTEYGSAVGWGRGIADSTPPQPYWFGSDGSSPYALYFPSSGEGVNFLPNWQVFDATGQALRYDAAMFRSDTSNAWGLSADAHIVTLEVNDGRGSNSGVHFVATSVTILDGTQDVPMDPVAVMRATKLDFDQRVAGVDAEFRVELEAARAKTAPPATVTFNASRAQGLWPTWRTTNQQLELTFVHRRDESWRILMQTLPNMSGAAPNPGAPMVPPRPVTLVYRYHAEYVVTYRFDANGEAISTQVHGPTAIVDPTTTEYN